MYFQLSRKNQDFLFLPLPSKPASIKNDHLRRRQILRDFDLSPPLPLAVSYYYPSANLSNFLPLPLKIADILKQFYLFHHSLLRKCAESATIELECSKFFEHFLESSHCDRRRSSAHSNAIVADFVHTLHR